MKSEKFELVIQALPSKPGQPEPSYMLRLLLKRILRNYGFRCVEVKPK